MKVFMKPVEMIAWFTIDGIPNPIKYKIREDSQDITIKVGRIISRDEEKLAGNKMYIFRCQSFFGCNEKVYELKYEISTCRWFLYKI